MDYLVDDVNQLLRYKANKIFYIKDYKGKDKIVVNGTAKFIRENETINFTQSCDIYEFDKDGNVEKITSYCIAKRN